MRRIKQPRDHREQGSIVYLRLISHGIPPPCEQVPPKYEVIRFIPAHNPVHAYKSNSEHQ